MGAERAIVWDESLLQYDLGGSHPLHPVRLALTIRLAALLGVLDNVRFVSPEIATDDQLRLVHDQAYLDAVRAAPEASEFAGHGLGTVDNPVFERMHEASALVVGGTLAAARQLHAGKAQRAVNIAGGLHHAMRDHASGFCVYNDGAVAIAWLLGQGVRRIAYVDTDVHHGDGVQAAFADDPRVLTISLHQHPHTLWPGTGFSTEHGDGDADGSVVNVALPPGTTDAQWLRAFHAVVPSLLSAFQPEVLVTQCGVDTHVEDPLAELSLTVDGHRAIYQALRQCADSYADKWLALGGGGYSLFRVVPRSWTHLLATVLDADIDPASPIPADWISYANGFGEHSLPTSMSDGSTIDFTSWDGDADNDLDKAIRATRRAVLPAHGLDPEDRRD